MFAIIKNIALAYYYVSQYSIDRKKVAELKGEASQNMPMKMFHSLLMLFSLFLLVELFFPVPFLVRLIVCTALFSLNSLEAWVRHKEVPNLTNQLFSLALIICFPSPLTLFAIVMLTARNENNNGNNTTLTHDEAEDTFFSKAIKFCSSKVSMTLDLVMFCGLIFLMVTASTYATYYVAEVALLGFVLYALDAMGLIDPKNKGLKLSGKAITSLAMIMSGNYMASMYLMEVLVPLLICFTYPVTYPIYEVAIDFFYGKYNSVNKEVEYKVNFAGKIAIIKKFSQPHRPLALRISYGYKLTPAFFEGEAYTYHKECSESADTVIQWVRETLSDQTSITYTPAKKATDVEIDAQADDITVGKEEVVNYLVEINKKLRGYGDKIALSTFAYGLLALNDAISRGDDTSQQKIIQSMLQFVDLPQESLALGLMVELAHHTPNEKYLVEIERFKYRGLKNLYNNVFQQDAEAFAKASENDVLQSMFSMMHGALRVEGQSDKAFIEFARGGSWGSTTYASCGHKEDVIFPSLFALNEFDKSEVTKVLAGISKEVKVKVFEEQINKLSKDESIALKKYFQEGLKNHKYNSGYCCDDSIIDNIPEDSASEEDIKVWLVRFAANLKYYKYIMDSNPVMIALDVAMLIELEKVGYIATDKNSATPSFQKPGYISLIRAALYRLRCLPGKIWKDGKELLHETAYLTEDVIASPVRAYQLYKGEKPVFRDRGEASVVEEPRLQAG